MAGSRYGRAGSQERPHTDPEELRQHIKMLARTWEFVRLSLPNREFLKDHTEEAWNTYLDWILGEKVWTFVVRAPDGSFNHRPSWSTLLTLNFQVRKKAYAMVCNDGVSLVTGLRLAMKDQELLNTHCMLPKSMSAWGGYGKSIRLKVHPATPKPKEDSA